MRAVCLLKRLEFDFSGNVFQNAVALGDVDNDGQNELIVGNMNGDLTIYKYDRPWQKFTGLGMITAIAVGDVLNCKSNALVVVSGDGWCNILTVPPRINPDDLSERGSKLESFHVQRIPANTKVALLEDIDGDECVELVLGLTDRVVRSYRWLLPKDDTGGRLLGLNKWECANQIGTITLNRLVDEDIPSLFVAQPGGSYMDIRCKSNSSKDLDESISSEGYGLADSSVEYRPLSYSRMRNSNVTTEILGGIRSHIVGKNGKNASLFAVATLDGTLMLVNDQDILWSMQVDHQVFAIRALDVTGDGCDEIVACAWNGHTYFLDQKCQTIRFQLEEPVASFTAGHYTLHPGEPPYPALVYTTFNNKVYLYPNVRIPTMVSLNFQPKTGLNESQTRQLTEWCLYGKRDK